MIKINGVDIAEFPSNFSVGLMDLDDGESSVRTADGTLNRDRITVKRKLEMSWGPLTWAKVSAILQSIENPFVSVTYPDTMTGKYETKMFYAGDRTATFMIAKGSEILWGGLKVTMTEK